jgi:hypothetical protein
MRREPKPRKCKVCRSNPVIKPGAVVCSTECAVALVTATRIKAERAAAKNVRHGDKARKVALKTLSDWIADTQKVFNAFIRARDAHLPCICCGGTGGAWSRGGIWDAGHYRSRGSAGHLRFDERNCHRQLKQCNSYGAGRHADFRVGLIDRIGLAAVEALEAEQTIHKWSIDELRVIKSVYQAKIKALGIT